MLILTRNVGQVVTIGDDIKITVTKAHKDGARLGIEAPADVPVHREEIYERIRRGEGRSE